MNPHRTPTPANIIAELGFPRKHSAGYIYSMNIVLGRYLNKRFIELRDGTRGEVVGVLTRFGDYRYVRWLGFVGR
jgi:hypothetical protein